MKTNLLVVLLACSLAANAALYFSRSAPAASAVNPGSGATTSASPASTAATTSAAETAQLAKVWTTLQSGDLKTLVVRLRAAGFSPAMIRSIVGGVLYEQFAARRKALLAQQQDVPFWATQQRSFMDPKTMAAMRQLSREQTNLLKELLGPDGQSDSDERDFYLRRQFGNLPREKSDQVQNIVSDYGELRTQIYNTANGLMLPEDREKLAFLDKEQRADLAAVLTPQELQDYELRSSTTASVLRSQLATFKPTEQEFRAIYDATRAAEEKYGAALGANSNQMKQIQTAVLESAQATLTPDRYADLKQATDPAYQLINRLAARLDLPASTAPQVVALQQDVMKRATAVRTDQSLTPDERNTQLSSLLQETTTKLTTVLGGQRGLEAYKQYGGQWLQMLQPRPAVPPRG